MRDSFVVKQKISKMIGSRSKMSIGTNICKKSGRERW